MKIALSRRWPVPIRQQLRKRLELKIHSGDLRAGAKPPAVRAPARTLGLDARDSQREYRRR
jgi:DNA-binding transcriptional regulator YhcF (GntR family)